MLIVAEKKKTKFNAVAQKKFQKQLFMYTVIYVKN